VPAAENTELNQSDMSLAVPNDTVMPEAGECGEFAHFPKLPLELRLRIWVLTFNKERVNLDIQDLRKHRLYLLPNPLATGRPKYIRPIFPVALHVSRESRTETLRHYCIMSTSDHVMTRTAPPPICLNLSLDTGVFDFNLVGSIKHSKQYTTWLSKLGSATRAGLSAVEELEISDISWFSPDKLAVEQEQLNVGGRKYMPNYILVLRLILLFTSLKKICFTWSGSLPYHEHQSLLYGTRVIVQTQMRAQMKARMKECRQVIEAFMSRHKEKFIGGRAPEVKVRNWCAVKKVFVCSTGFGEGILEKREESVWGARRRYIQD
jgi:hypothetical protein